jgi:tRNA dimethylallyltransferase
VKKNIFIISGPTASGKSSLAVAIAKQKKGVVINADSLQIYDGLPLLTAKPSTQDISSVPHHLYSIYAAQDDKDVMDWRADALKEIDHALAQNLLPIVVGGTGFYLKALTEGLSPLPDVPADIRARVRHRHQDMGHEKFAAEFQKNDPEMSAKIDLHNPQRVMRAAEVLEATGKSLSHWQSLPKTGVPDHYRFHIIHILPVRDVLYTRCNERFKQMMDQNALEEVRTFKNKNYTSSPLFHALGYRELSDHLDGKLSLDDAITLAQQKTRHYAKRQMTWLLHQQKADQVLTAPDATLLDDILIA